MFENPEEFRPRAGTARLTRTLPSAPVRAWGGGVSVSVHYGLLSGMLFLLARVDGFYLACVSPLHPICRTMDMDSDYITPLRG